MEARGLRAIRAVEDVLLITLLAIMVLLAGGQILLRNLFDFAIPWGDPLLRLLVLWVGLLGAVAASREDKHIRIDVLSGLLPERARKLSALAVAFFTAALSALLSYHAGRFALMEYEAGSLAFGPVPSWVAVSILPFGFGVIALHYLLLAVARARALLAATRPE